MRGCELIVVWITSAWLCGCGGTFISPSPGPSASNQATITFGGLGGLPCVDL